MWGGSHMFCSLHGPDFAGLGSSAMWRTAVARKFPGLFGSSCGDFITPGYYRKLSDVAFKRASLLPLFCIMLGYFEGLNSMDLKGQFNSYKLFKLCA